MPGAEFLFGLIGAGFLVFLTKLLKALGIRAPQKEDDA